MASLLSSSKSTFARVSRIFGKFQILPSSYTISVRQGIRRDWPIKNISNLQEWPRHMKWSSKKGHLVKPRFVTVGIQLQNQQGFDSRESSEAVGYYKTSGCSQPRPAVLPRGSHSDNGWFVLSSGFWRTVQRQRCPSICLYDSCYTPCHASSALLDRHSWCIFKVNNKIWNCLTFIEQFQLPVG